MMIRQPVSVSIVMAVTFLLMLILPGSALALGTCRKEGKCPCTKDQEKQGMKTIGGNCVDCAGNAKKLDELRRNRMMFRAELEKQKELADEGRIKADSRWYDFQQELPHFSDAARGYADLPARVLGVANAIQNSSSGGPYQLRANLSHAYRDLSQMAALIKSPMNLGRLVSDLNDSVRYADQYMRNYETGDLEKAIADLDKQIDEHLKVKAKCDGKGEKKSERKNGDDFGMYAAAPPAFVRLAGAASSGNQSQTPCRSSRDNLKQCQEAQQLLTDVHSFDFPETHVAFGDALLILEPFSRESGNKLADQEVLERAKQADPALKKLAGLLDRLVTRSNRVLALLKGGAS